MRFPASLTLEKMTSFMLSACVAASALAATSTASALVPTFSLTDKSLTDSEPMGVTLDDLVRFAPLRVSDAGILQKLIKSNDERIFLAGDSICGIPSVGKVLDANKTICGNTYLEAAPHSDDGKVATYQLAILMETAQGPTFRKVSVEVSPGVKGRAVTNVTRQIDVPVSQTAFSISVGLVPNIQVLQDATNGLLIVSPIGNGGLTLDQGPGTPRQIMTPTFVNRHAALRKSAAIPSLNLDYYYEGEPYIAITVGPRPQDVKSIAFHVTIMSVEDWNGGKGSETLARGYESHGCMRMRLHDLFVLYTIVTQGPNPVPVTVDYFASLMDQTGQPLVNDESDPINAVQPYPYTGGFQQEKNMAGNDPVTGLPLPPATARDTDPTINHHEIQMEQVNGKVPYARLVGFDGEDETALAAYDSEMSKHANALKKPLAKKQAPKPIDPAPVVPGDQAAPSNGSVPLAQP